jgi:DNA-binding NtrC family response regulator
VLSQKRLLFVDDEPGIRNTLPEILRRYGFSVTVASTVSEAIEHICNQPFDLLLCDLNIESEADGYKVVRAIREVNPKCVVIILTGYPGLETALEGIHLAIDDYIVKPAKADVLVAQLAERLAARRAQTNSELSKLNPPVSEMGNRKDRTN